MRYALTIATAMVYIRKMKPFYLFIVAVCLVLPPSAGCGGGETTPSPNSSYFGEVIETAAVELDAAEGQSLSLPDGTSLDIPAGSLANDTELSLMRSEVPGLDEYDLITDVYYVASAEWTPATGDYTLAIPYDVSLLPEGVSEEELQAFTVLDGPFVFPVPCHVDSDRQVVIIDNPNITISGSSGGLTARFLGPALPVETVTSTSSRQTTGSDVDSNWGYFVGRRKGPAYGERPPWVTGDTRLTCIEGAAGEVHEEEGHIFRIVLETPTECQVVKEISSLLTEALASLQASYDFPVNFSSTNRMNVIISDYEKAAEFNPRGSIGYIKIGHDWYLQTDAADHRRLVFHELFHYAQDAHTKSRLSTAIAEWWNGDAKWWYEATAEWVGQEAGGKSAEEQAKLMLSSFPELLSVPIQKSGDYDAASYVQDLVEGSKYYYGYAVLINHVESVSPGYVNEALNSWNMSSSALYSAMVEAGNLSITYPDFIRDIMEMVLPDPGFWIPANIIETASRTTIQTHWFNAGGSGNYSPKDYTNDEDRTGPHRLFADSMGPLTAQFFRLQFQGVANEPRCVNVQLSQDGQSSDQAWLVPVNGSQTGTPVRLSSSGTKIGGMGQNYDELWIAIFNSDPNNDKSFELNVELLDDGQCQEGTSEYFRLDETKLSTLPEQPYTWSDQFGSHSATFTLNNNEIGWDIRTAGTGGTVAGVSTLNVNFEVPNEVPVGEEVETVANWTLTVSGEKPRYTMGYVELYGGTSYRELKRFTVDEEPTGTSVLKWKIMQNQGEFEVKAKVPFQGGYIILQWIYRPADN